MFFFVVSDIYFAAYDEASGLNYGLKAYTCPSFCCRPLWHQICSGDLYINSKVVCGLYALGVNMNLCFRDLDYTIMDDIYRT